MAVKRVFKKLARFVSLKMFLPMVYAHAAKQPIDAERVVFLEISADHLTDSFVLLEKELRARGKKTELICIHDGSAGGFAYLKNCAQMLRRIAVVPLVFINEASNITSCVSLRPETRIVQTWHGCGAFKKFGFSTADGAWGITRREMERYPYYKNQWLVSVSAPEAVAAYQDAMHQPEGVIQPLGVSRTDVFFDAVYRAQARRRLLECFPQAKGKKVILYAPTFRGTQTQAHSMQMEHVRLRDALSEQYVWIEKHHPFVKKRPEIHASCSDFAADLTEQMNIAQLLCVSDVCVSDYSSLVFEYALFERPMLFFAPDLTDYFNARGFYYDYETLTPGPVCVSQPELIAHIRQLDTSFDRQRVHAFRERFMSACDGHATQRILDYIECGKTHASIEEVQAASNG